MVSALDLDTVQDIFKTLGTNITRRCAENANLNPTYIFLEVSFFLTLRMDIVSVLCTFKITEDIIQETLNKFKATADDQRAEKNKNCNSVYTFFPELPACPFVLFSTEIVSTL